jgi:hypothetical protein
MHLSSQQVRLTTRLWRTLARSIADSGRNVTEVAYSHGVSWPTAHDAFMAEVDRLTRLWNTLADDPTLTDLHLAWIAKEMLRDILALRTIRSGTKPSKKGVLDRWDDLAAWRETNKHISELDTFMTKLNKWIQEITKVSLAGASNAGSEGINRIQKLDAQASSGYRNPDNQRRRARVATLRSRTQRQLRTVKTRSLRTVTASQPNPG